MTETPSPDRDELLQRWLDFFQEGEISDALRLLPDLREAGVSDDEILHFLAKYYRSLPQEHIT